MKERKKKKKAPGLSAWKQATAFKPKGRERHGEIMDGLSLRDSCFFSKLGAAETEIFLTFISERHCLSLILYNIIE